ncbi:MAG: helix-turn-helix domain-containing protein [Gemmatimonadota bacterium]|nr:helix-turn-helix domain-containing protein [Gemmatimonadota bacterium]
MDVSQREKLLRVSAVAELLDISDQRAYELVRTGMLPAIRVGRQIRVAPAALEEWIGSGGSVLPGGWRKEPSE